MKDLQLPLARKKGLVIQELPGEILIYDLDTHKAHCLNQTSSTVWRYCDGEKNITDITKLITQEAGSPVPEDLVWLAIDQLNESNLLEKNALTNFSRQNRRELIKKVGLAAVVALPLVTSLVAPKAVQAGSACPNTQTCFQDSDCNLAVCTSGCVGEDNTTNPPTPGICTA